MTERVPAPDGRKSSDGGTLSVLAEGTVLNFAYEVSYLCAGGMGIVYKGRKGNETYCIKEVESSQLPRVFALSQEKATLERLEHPGIEKVIDCFDEEGYLYLVLEFVEGRDIAAIIQQGSDEYIKEQVIEKWAAQLYDIFQYLHRQTPPIIYRDLKPHNIMCRPDGSLCLIDFGIARVHKETKSADTYSYGTALTASPEHYGDKQTDARSDIFTIGATLHYIATNGKGSGKGFFEYTPVRTIHPDLSENLERIIIKALQVLPGDRFQSVSEMRAAHLGKPELEETPAGQSVIAPSTPADGKYSGSVNPVFPRALIAYVIAAILLLSAVVLFLSKDMLTTGKNSSPPASAAPEKSLPAASAEYSSTPTPSISKSIDGTGTESPPVPGMRVAFQGCTVMIPSGYSHCRNSKDEYTMEYQKKYKHSKNYRKLQVYVRPINPVPESRQEKETMLKKIVDRYMIKNFKNEVTIFNEGNMRATPDGARMDLYRFEALSNDEEKALHGIFTTHEVTILIHDNKAFLLIAHADSKDFPYFSGEFASFFSSLSFQERQN
jgi:serine/threonine protein kinase